MDRRILARVGLCLFTIVLLFAGPAVAQNPSASQWHAVHLQIEGPTLETTIVGFQLKGPGLLDRISLQDFDILLTEDGQRLVPLLRLLHLLKVEVKQKGDTLRFQPPASAVRFLDFRQEVYWLQNQPRQAVQLRMGISDATFNPDIYLADSVAARLLAFPLQWDQGLFAYRSTTDKNFEVFVENYRKMRALFSNQEQIHSLSRPLPEVLSPAKPTPSSNLLTFLELRLFGSANGFKNPVPSMQQAPQTLQMNYTLHPQMQVWGRLLGGNYSLELGKNYFFPVGAFKPQLQFRGEWTRQVSNLGLTLGDNNIRFNDLIFPYLSLRGIAFGGASGIHLQNSLQGKFAADQFLSPLQVFDGYAPLDSKVELYINGRLYDQKQVREDIHAPTGQGSYRFDGVNLLTGYLNDVLIVIQRPDGLRQEIHRQVLGTQDFLRSGQWALVGGVGKQRIFSFGGDQTQGFFGGGQFLYGLTSWMTLGFAAAMQNKINQLTSFFTFAGAETYRRPLQSYHLGFESAIRLNDHVISRMKVAASRARDHTRWFLGGQYSTEIQFGRLRFEPRIFRYDPNFYNGVNPELQDKQGFSFRSYLQLADKYRMQINLGSIYNNIWNKLPQTTRVNFLQSTLSLINIVPRTNLNLTADYRQVYHLPSQVIYRLEATTRLPANLTFSGRYRIGQDRTPFGVNQMFLFPGSGYFPFFDNQKLFLTLGWSPLSSYSLLFSHWQSKNFNRSLLTYTYRSPINGHWQARLEAGRDWKRKAFYTQNRIEYSMDPRGENRIGLLARFEGFWSVEVIFQLQNLFGVSPVGINRLKDVQIEPGQKGIWGKIFLDTNANGIPEPDEPGVAGIEVYIKDLWGVKTKSYKNGFFFFPINSQLDSLEVSLKTDSLPAIYTVTQGRQKARLQAGTFTRVFLGIASLGSISGNVNEQGADNQLQGISGIRVLLLQADSFKIAGTSITDRFGGYYFGEVRPGDYYIGLDAHTLPKNYNFQQDSTVMALDFEKYPQIVQRLNIDTNKFNYYPLRKVTMSSAGEPIDLDHMNFLLKRK